jgi:hypothetical protein
VIAFFLSMVVAAHAVGFGAGLPGDPDQPIGGPPGIPFDSRQEGIYQVKLTCDPAPDQCNPTLLKDIDRITIIDSHGSRGVWVTLATTAIHDVIDTFMFVDVGPTNTEITGVPRGMSGMTRFSWMKLKVDPATGMITGSLMDIRSTGTYKISGQSITRMADLLSPAPITGAPVGALIGVYKGKLGNMAGSMNVRQRPDGQLLAFFASDSQHLGVPDFSLSFDGGAWNSVTGILQMTFFNRKFMAQGELNLAMRGAGQLEGFYTTTFVDLPAAFVKV